MVLIFLKKSDPHKVAIFLFQNPFSTFEKRLSFGLSLVHENAPSARGAFSIYKVERKTHSSALPWVGSSLSSGKTFSFSDSPINSDTLTFNTRAISCSLEMAISIFPFS